MSGLCEALKMRQSRENSHETASIMFVFAQGEVRGYPTFWQSMMREETLDVVRSYIGKNTTTIVESYLFNQLPFIAELREATICILNRILLRPNRESGLIHRDGPGWHPAGNFFSFT